MLTSLDLWLNVRRASGNPLLTVTGSSVQEGADLHMVAGDVVRLSLFLREYVDGVLTPVVVPAGHEIVLAGKKVQEPGQELFLASGFVLEGEGDDSRYVADLSLNTTQIIQAVQFLAIDKTLAVRCDLEFQAELGTRRRTIQFDASIRQQVHTGGNPPDEADPPYPLPGDLMLLSLYGSHAVAESEQLVEIDISGHGLTAAPARFKPTIRGPAADSPLIFCMAVGDLTADIITVALSAPAPSAGYIIDYDLVPGA